MRCFTFICFWKETELNMGQQYGTEVEVGGSKSPHGKPSRERQQDGPLIPEL